MDRRSFLGRLGNARMVAATSVAAQRAIAHTAANNNVSVAITGVNGRGRVPAELSAAQADVDIPYICEVDRKAETIPGDPEACRLLTREYREHWSSRPFV